MDKIITKHAYKRIKERCGLKKKAVEKLMLDLERDGVSREDTTCRLRGYLDHIYQESGEVMSLVLHRGYVFLFSKEDDILVTVWGVPNEYKKQALAQEKRREEGINR